MRDLNMEEEELTVYCPKEKKKAERECALEKETI